MNYLRAPYNSKADLKHTSLGGFTLIEVLVSISIFVLAVSLGVLAVITMDQASKRVRLKDQTVQSAYFLMDSISRSIRTGYSYQCLDFDQEIVTCPENSPGTPGVPGLEYYDQNNEIRRVWFDGAEKVQACKGTPCILSDYHSPDALQVQTMEFFGVGIETVDSVQPIIVIRAQFSYTFKGVDYMVPFQTSLTQRKIDAVTTP